MHLLTTSKSIQDILAQSLDISQQFERLSFEYILVTMVSAALCGLLVYLVYRFFYRGVVYSDNFNILLVLVTVVTAFVIMTISSNLVLSLGMVGALSIVRFRSAIKDPLDIGFLFWGIAAGVTCGAGLYFIALMGTSLISIIYILATFAKKGKKSYLLILHYSEQLETEVNAVLSGMKYRLKNKTYSDAGIELTIEIKMKNNDTSVIKRFREVPEMGAVTLLEYVGEYMN
jgi:uncharacterized membrane protein YhiD involved in acid resistance